MIHWLIQFRTVVRAHSNTVIKLTINVYRVIKHRLTTLDSDIIIVSDRNGSSGLEIDTTRGSTLYDINEK